MGIVVKELGPLRMLPLHRQNVHISTTLSLSQNTKPKQKETQKRKSIPVVKLRGVTRSPPMFGSLL